MYVKSGLSPAFLFYAQPHTDSTNNRYNLIINGEIFKKVYFFRKINNLWNFFHYITILSKKQERDRNYLVL